MAEDRKCVGLTEVVLQLQVSLLRCQYFIVSSLKVKVHQDELTGLTEVNLSDDTGTETKPINSDTGASSGQ